MSDPRPDLGGPFGQFLRDTFADPDDWADLLTPQRAFQCSYCHKPNQIRVLDVNALDKLLTQFYGKPAEPERLVRVDVTHRQLRDLSDDELAAIASGQATIDGEAWGDDELPPAA